ncbi:leukocyte elastase inhibitor [Parasteatoda tepidariorum]|uniref:leukocyte elastase inhibitor n=1 Tax=Parasteatoda tepidariorum TaxID=114398 RepID=UPI001C71DBCC|nr:leukocyte elastase inhibitor [Parasteatoda tepidariorum]
MAYQLFTILLVSSILALIGAQCITSNDIIVNETSIGITVRNLIEGSTRFSMDLLRTLNEEQRHNKDANGVFFSPYSIWSALLITYMGARGATEQEMKNVLGLSDSDKATVWEAFRNIRNNNFYKSDSFLQDLFEPALASYQSANRIYFQEGTTFKDCMRELLADDIAFLDFANRAEEARNTINSYVEQETNNRIKYLIPPNGISALTRMVVANAVYFKETWQNQFDPQKTSRRRFTTPYRKDIFVNMMKTRGKFLYGRSEELQCYALELPYTGNTLSMIILLPRNRYSGVDILANNLTPQRLRNLINDMYPREVFVQLPKFKTENSFELSSVLDKMGLRSLFDTRKVDLSGFTGQREFSVDAVIHKSFIDVNEEGTEAAGATAIVSSRSAKELEIAAFVADYPFVYLIMDNLSNTILFLGTVRKPPEIESS